MVDPECPRPTRLVQAVASAEWPNLYHGVLDDVSLGPIDPKAEPPVITLDFPDEVLPIESLFVLLGYETNGLVIAR